MFPHLADLNRQTIQTNGKRCPWYIWPASDIAAGERPLSLQKVTFSSPCEWGLRSHGTVIMELALSRICPLSLSNVLVACSTFISDWRKKISVATSLLFEGYHITLSPYHLSSFRIHDCCEMCFFVQYRMRIHPSNNDFCGRVFSVGSGFLR